MLYLYLWLEVAHAQSTGYIDKLINELGTGAWMGEKSSGSGMINRILHGWGNKTNEKTNINKEREDGKCKKMIGKKKI